MPLAVILSFFKFTLTKPFAVWSSRRTSVQSFFPARLSRYRTILSCGIIYNNQFNLSHIYA
jgi:hypothetical protein